MTNQELINTINRIRLRSINLRDESLSNKITDKISSKELKNEDYVLGSFLQDDISDENITLPGFLMYDYFYSLENQLIFKTIIDLFSIYWPYQATNIEAVGKRLLEKGILEEAGGLEKLVYLKQHKLQNKQFDFINDKIINCPIIFCGKKISKANRKLINSINRIILRTLILKNNTSVNETDTEDLDIENAILGYFLKNSCKNLFYRNILQHFTNGSFLSRKNQIIFDIMIKLQKLHTPPNCENVIKELESDKAFKTIEIEDLKHIDKLKKCALSDKQINSLSLIITHNTIIHNPNSTNNQLSHLGV